jgi:hypothetical protein
VPDSKPKANLTFTLQSGRKIPGEFIKFNPCRFDMTDNDDKLRPHLHILERNHFPFERECLVIMIDGEGADEPDFDFMFIGVKPPAEQLSSGELHKVTSAEPLYVSRGTQKELLCFVWQKLAILKADRHSFCAETHNPYMSMPHSFRSQISTQQVSPHTPIEGRAAAMRQLVKGYEAMRKIWDAVNAPIKYTKHQAIKLSDKLIADAMPYISIKAPSKKAKLAIEPLATKMGIGKQKIYDLDKACLFYGEESLIERLQNLYKREQGKFKPS